MIKLRTSRLMPGTNLSQNLLWGLTASVVLVLVAYPVGRILLLAIYDPAGRRSSQGKLWSELVSPLMWQAFSNTMVMAVVSTVIAGCLAVPMAWLGERSNMQASRTVSSLVFLSFMNPPLLLGLAYIMVFGPNVGILTGLLGAIGIESTIYSWWGLIWVTVCGSYAIIYMTTASALAGIDGDLENAGRSHGASTGRILITIAMPLVKPAIVSGCLLAFVMSLNAFGIQALIATPARIPLLTTTIYSYFSYPVQFSGAASQAVVLIGVSVLVTVLANLYIAAKTFPTIVGKGARADVTVLSRRGRIFASFYCWAILGVSIILPMSAVVITSFIKVQGQGFVPGNLGLQNYIELFSLGDVVPSLANSFQLGLMAAVLMVAVALGIAYFSRQHARFAKSVHAIAEVPFVIPGIVLSVGMIAAFSGGFLNLYGTMSILVFAYVSKFLPIAIRFTENSLGQVGNELEEAVYAHGGSKGMAFRRVLVPLIRRGIVTAAILSFIFAFNELSASILLVGTGTQVSSTVLLHYAEEGLVGPMNSFAAVLFLVTACAYAVVTKLTGRSMTTAAF